MKIEVNGSIYTIKTKLDKQANSNYNMAVHVYRNKEKTPICGWFMKHTDSNYKILEYAINSIKDFENPKDLF